MNTEQIERAKIRYFFEYMDDLFCDFKRLLDDEKYSARKEIVINCLFSLLSLFSTAYCAGKSRSKGELANEREFLDFLDRFWDSPEKGKQFTVNANTGKPQGFNGKEILWKIRNLFAHEFRQPSMTFTFPSDTEVIVQCPVENISSGNTNVEFGVHAFNLLRDTRQMSHAFQQYCVEKGCDPRTNLPFGLVYLGRYNDTAQQT